MAKFTIEVDTETKMSKVFVEGNEIPVQEFSVSQYASAIYKDGNTTNDEKYCTYFSITQKEQDGSRISYGISFDSDGNRSESYSINNYNVAKEVAKVHENAAQAAKIEKIVAKKPVKVIHIEDWYRLGDHPVETLKEPTFTQ